MQARKHPLTEEQKTAKRVNSKMRVRMERVRVERVFGAPHAMGGHIVRTIGIACANFQSS